jgi:hypothetical protein
MPAEPNAVEQAVSRTLRDNLEKIQRAANELHQALNDLVSACASSRPSNALPSMIRAQTSAASLSATLEVLSRFVTGSLQPPMRMPFESDVLHVPSMSAPPLPTLEQPPPPPAHPKEEISWRARTPVVPPPRVSEVPPPVDRMPAVPAPQPPVEPPAPPPAMQIPVVEIPSVVAPAPTSEPAFVNDPFAETLPAPLPDIELNLPGAVPPAVEPAEAPRTFDLDSLPVEEQELHRRAFRVAKVAMQDIRMLRPEEVRLGRENKDLCSRLRDDIEKAHKEYDRRFQAIQGHPVDYFYDWMVEILAGGDPQALGEYPYPSPVLRR